MNEEMRAMIHEEARNLRAMIQEEIRNQLRFDVALTNERINSLEAELESLGRVVEALGVWAEIEIQQLEAVNKA